jgi:hypothetical protein
VFAFASSLQKTVRCECDNNELTIKCLTSEVKTKRNDVLFCKTIPDDFCCVVWLESLKTSIVLSSATRPSLAPILLLSVAASIARL